MYNQESIGASVCLIIQVPPPPPQGPGSSGALWWTWRTRSPSGVTARRESPSSRARNHIPGRTNERRGRPLNIKSVHRHRRVGWFACKQPKSSCRSTQDPEKGLENLCLAWEDAPFAERRIQAVRSSTLRLLPRTFQTAWYVGCLPASHLSETEHQARLWNVRAFSEPGPIQILCLAPEGACVNHP